MKEKELIFDIYEKISGQSDLDWAEIRLNHGLDCHPDTLRKAALGIKMAADAGVLNFDKASTEAQAEIYKAKRQFYDQRREYNKMLTADARWDHLAEEMVKAANRLNAEKVLKPASYMRPISFNKNEAVLCLADWHFGLIADNLWNQYSPEIADQRISKLIAETKQKLIANRVSKLHIIILGDMIAGDIHTSIRVQSCENAVDQIMHVSERLAELISDLAEDVDMTDVYCTYGNHARVVANLNDSVHADNMERIIPFWLEQRLKHRNDIRIIGESTYELIRVVACGHEIAAVHGDLDAGKNNSMLTMSMLYEKNFGKKMEYMILGHWHKRYTNEDLGIEQIGIGSLCGTDEYAKNKRLFSKPSQTLLIFDEDGLDSIHNIIL